MTEEKEVKKDKMDKTQKGVLSVLFVGVLMGALDIAIIGPALPQIRDFFSLSNREASWLINIYVLFNLMGTPVLAKLSDLWGRRNAYVSSVLLFGIGSLIISGFDNYALVMLGRAIQGFGAGGIFPVATAVIGDTFPPEKRGKVLGLIGAVFGIAFIIGPIIGGILLKISWHMIFIINIPIAAYVIFKSWKILPSKPVVQKKEKLDFKGLFVLILILAFFNLGVNQLKANTVNSFIESFTSFNVLPLLLLSIVLLPVLILIERKAPSPIVKFELLSKKQLLLANFLCFGGGLTESAITFLPAFSYFSFNVTVATASFMMIPLVIALSIGSPFSGRMIDRIGSKKVVISGATVLSTGLGLLYFLPATYFNFYLATIFIGFGLSGLHGTPVRYIILNETGVENRSVAQALATIFTSVGRLLSASVIGAVASSFVDEKGYKVAFLSISLIACLLIFVSMALKNREQELETINSMA